MNKLSAKHHSRKRFESTLNRYKELIITTVICLFLTGIYDSINTQTVEIRKWYQLMVNLQAEQKIQSVDLKTLKEALENHRELSDVRFNNHGDRIRTLEFEIIHYKQRNEKQHE